MWRASPSTAGGCHPNRHCGDKFRDQVRSPLVAGPMRAGTVMKGKVSAGWLARKLSTRIGQRRAPAARPPLETPVPAADGPAVGRGHLCGHRRKSVQPRRPRVGYVLRGCPDAPADPGNGGRDALPSPDPRRKIDSPARPLAQQRFALVLPPIPLLRGHCLPASFSTASAMSGHPARVY